MKKYLQQLHADIEFAIRQAPPMPENGWMPRFGEEEDESGFSFNRPVKLSDLFQINPVAFPPENLLSDEQVKNLLNALNRLWKSWKLFWEMPLYLPERKKYTAMVREMKGEPVKWDPENGGEVTICRFEESSYCPFTPDDSYCFCRYIDESVRHDIAIWEEHVRSKGIDPGRKLSAEEEATHERELMIRELQQMYGDDWEKYADADLLHGEQPEEAKDYQRYIDLEDEFSFDPFLEDYEEEIDEDIPPPNEEDKDRRNDLDW